MKAKHFFPAILTAMALFFLGACTSECNIVVESNNPELGVVDGGGVYTKGDLVTISAVARPGAMFVKWDNGSKLPKFSFEADGDAHYVAQFERQYTITLNSGNGGRIEINGDTSNMVRNGNQCVIKCTQSHRYRFYAYGDHDHVFDTWSDGVKTSYRDVVSPKQDLTLDASFVEAHYLGVSFSPSDGGFVEYLTPNDGGTSSPQGPWKYKHGKQVELVVRPTDGYRFKRWSIGDGSGTNESIRFTMNSDMNIVAYFARVVNISAVVHPQSSGTGSVSGGGNYDQGSTATLTVNPSAGCVFTKWSDGNTDNPRTVQVTADHTYEAYIERAHTITANVDNPSLGTVTGGGVYAHGSTCTLTATPKGSNEFLRWNDGVTTNPRSVIVNTDATYTAYFNKMCSITTAVTPSGSGTVTGAGTYAVGTTVTLTATSSNSNDYQFKRWSDGNTQNPRTVTVSSDAHYVAEFGKMFDVKICIRDMRSGNVLSSNPSSCVYGTATGAGRYMEGSTVQLRAIPGLYHFSGWDIRTPYKANYDNPRTVTVTGDVTYFADFQQCTTLVRAIPVTAGNASCNNTYCNVGTSVTLTATAYSGWRFDHWANGSSSNPYTFIASKSYCDTAFFVGTYKVQVQSANTAMGTVSGEGTYDVGKYATIRAVPADGYVFKQWNDGNTSNPRQVTLSNAGSTVTYTATFAPAPIRTYTVGGVSFNMIYVEGGTFTMGADAYTDRNATLCEGIQHQVTLSSFYISETEVSEPLYKAVMGRASYNSVKNTQPAIMPHKAYVDAFVAALNTKTGKTFILPTDAQWEYAARDRGQNYAFAHSNDSSKINGGIPTGTWSAADVLKNVNDGPKNSLGLYHMNGNALEWTRDTWTKRFSSTAVSDPVVTGGTTYVVRGGCVGHHKKDCRNTVRYNFTSIGNMATENCVGSGVNLCGARLVLIP